MIADRVATGILASLASQRIRYIRPVPYGERSGLVARVYDQMARDFQIVPPLTLHSPVPPLLAGVWTALRESYLAGPASRLEREAVVATVSRLNACPYCVEVHTLSLDAGRERALAGAIARGTDEGISDPQMRRLVNWAAATLQPGTEILRHPPFPPEHAPQTIGSALAFHYVNRVVSVFLEESPFPENAPVLKRMVRWMAGKAFGKQVHSEGPPPGDSLALLPEAELPPEFQWADGNPFVAGAWGRFATAAEEAGQGALSGQVRQLVLSHVNAWNGGQMPLGRGWVEDAVAPLPDGERASARLALLSALAAHQVDEGVIEAVRRQQADDAALVRIAAWASFAATRRISSWLRGSAR